MKAVLQHINDAFTHRIRLGIMSALVVQDQLDFSALKQLLEVTDGNLASHLKKLEAEAFIEVKKSFIGRKPNTRYQPTAKGRKAFESHLKALEALIQHQKTE